MSPGEQAAFVARASITPGKIYACSGGTYEVRHPQERRLNLLRLRHQWGYWTERKQMEIPSRRPDTVIKYWWTWC